MMKQSILSKEISNNIKLIRKLEDLLIKHNYQLITYNHRYPIDYMKLCGEHMADSVEGMIDDDDEDIIKYAIIDRSGTVVSILIGELNETSIDDLYRCKDMTMTDISGGEILLCYILLKYNMDNANIVTIKGGISGSIPPIDEKNDNPRLDNKNKNQLLSILSIMKQTEAELFNITNNFQITEYDNFSKEQLIDIIKKQSTLIINKKQDNLDMYHKKRNANVTIDEYGRKYFSYNVKTIIENTNKLLLKYK